jgi:hypothetical protein
MNTDWLAQLAPEYAPAAARWWPPAPGWWLVAAVLLTAVAFLVIRLRDPRRRLRRRALAELRRVREGESDVLQCAREVQNLLRRYALAVFGPDEVARLSGQSWLDFLASRGAEPFKGSAGRSLLAASYSGRLDDAQHADRELWLRGAEHFVRRAARQRRRA